MGRIRGFTLVELLIVIIIIAVLAAVVIPRFSQSSQRAAEGALRQNLKVLRKAVEQFYQDTDRYPKQLSDVAALSAPATGINGGGLEKPIDPALWKGPYASDVPADPISNAPFAYTTTKPGLGTVKSSASGNALDGSPYSSW